MVLPFFYISILPYLLLLFSFFPTGKCCFHLFRCRATIYFYRNHYNDDGKIITIHLETQIFQSKKTGINNR